jgi:hypothetical protein
VTARIDWARPVTLLVGSALAVDALAQARRRAPSDFLVVWRTFAQDGDSYGVIGRRYDSSGGAVAAEFVINSHTVGLQASPAAAMDADGDFVVAWQSFLQDGSSYGVFARRFDSSGAPQAAEFHVNAFTANTQNDPAVAMHDDGRFVIAWESALQDGAAPPSIFARRYDSGGAAQASEFQVNTYATGNQTNAAVAFDDSGAFVIGWDSAGQDGSANGADASRTRDRWRRKQRYSGSFATLDVDANGAFEPLTDALLILRRGFGFGGSTLTTGALGTGCMRCLAPDIETYLAGLIG